MSDPIPLFEACAGAHSGLPTVRYWRTCYHAGAQLEAEGEVQLPPGLLEEVPDSGDRTLFTVASLLATALAAQVGDPFVDLVRQAVAAAREIGVPIDALSRAFAAIAVRANDPRSAALLLGRETDHHRFASSRTVHELVQAALVDAELDRLVAEGSRLTDDELITLALTLGAP